MIPTKLVESCQLSRNMHGRGHRQTAHGQGRIGLKRYRLHKPSTATVTVTIPAVPAVIAVAIAATIWRTRPIPAVKTAIAASTIRCVTTVASPMTYDSVRKIGLIF